MKDLSRRQWLQLVSALGASAASGAARAADAKPIRAVIPRTGEPLPVIGLGTWQTFDVGRAAATREPLRDVLREFVALGGKVVDSSPMYGESERVVGDLTAGLGLRDKLFLATKVWTSGRNAGVKQMQESLKLLRAERLDLMQVHNLVDWRTHLATLHKWKDEGRVRYVGVTHYTEGGYDELERVLKSEDIEFVQLNYSIAEREAEKRLLSLAAERRIAVMVNRPFAKAALFEKVRGKDVPGWARELGCTTWAQYFLKFVISHPSVTCAIPATSKLTHLRDNMQAGFEPLPNAVQRERMAKYVAGL